MMRSLAFSIWIIWEFTQKWELIMPKSQIVIASFFISDSSPMKSILQPSKESLNYKSCLVVMFVTTIWYDKFGITLVWNATINSITSQIIPDVFCIITLVCIYRNNFIHHGIIQIIWNWFHYIYKFCTIMFIGWTAHNWYW